MANDTTQHDKETEYEKIQRFNFLVSYLHSFRYRNILDVFRAFIRENGDRTINVVDIGCAHAKLFSLLNENFDIDYTGVEVNYDLVMAARSRYDRKPNFRVIHDSVANILAELKRADIIVALESFEHIPEHEVVRIIEVIATVNPRLFVCSVPVEIGPSIWIKNVGSLVTGYIRHKEYSWPETFWAGLYQLDRLPPHGIRHKGFDWRWLAQTIRHNMRVREIRKFPFAILPAALAFSVFIIAEPRQ